MDSQTLKINVCMGSSCFARGNIEHLEFIEKFLEDNNIKNQVDLEGSRCEGKCDIGPNIYVNGVLYSKVSKGDIEQILKEHIKII